MELSRKNEASAQTPGLFLSNTHFDFKLSKGVSPMNVQSSRRKINGTRCQSHTVRDADRTTRLHKGRTGHVVSLSAAETTPADGSIELHAIGDSASIQRALSIVINAVAAGTLDPARAKVLLYGLQIAATNARRMAANKKTEETASSIEAAGDGNLPATSSTPIPAIQEPQPAIVNPREPEAKSGKDEALEKDKLAEAVAQTPAPSISSEHTSVEPSSFGSVDGYSSPHRERLLAMNRRSASHSVV
jgi:hypothetical protein